MAIQAIVPFLTLVLLELVLGVDNILLITLLVEKLDLKIKARVRTLGMFLALASRIGLLVSIKWLVSLTNPIFTIGHFDVSAQNLILFGGGAYLAFKSMEETQKAMLQHEGHALDERHNASSSSAIRVIAQIVVMDAIFSIDSILTAVGIADELKIMVAAVVIAVIIMMFLSGPIGAFIEKNIVVKLQALHFLFLVGATLLLEGMHVDIPRNDLYIIMGGIIMFEAWKTTLHSRAMAKTKL